MTFSLVFLATLNRQSDPAAPVDSPRCCRVRLLTSLNAPVWPGELRLEVHFACPHPLTNDFKNVLSYNSTRYPCKRRRCIFMSIV